MRSVEHKPRFSKAGLLSARATCADTFAILISVAYRKRGWLCGWHRSSHGAGLWLAAKGGALQDPALLSCRAPGSGLQTLLPAAPLAAAPVLRFSLAPRGGGASWLQPRPFPCTGFNAGREFRCFLPRFLLPGSSVSLWPLICGGLEISPCFPKSREAQPDFVAKTNCTVQKQQAVVNTGGFSPKCSQRQGLVAPGCVSTVGRWPPVARSGPGGRLRANGHRRSTRGSGLDHPVLLRE